jgi:hypothetical protein
MSVRRLANVLERDSNAPSERCAGVADYDVDARQPPHNVFRFSTPPSLLVRQPVIFLIFQELRNEVNAKRIRCAASIVTIPG